MASDEQIGDYFGTSIAISGEYAIIGATGVNGETNNDGAAYIFQKKDSSWEEKYKIIPDSLVGEAYFGHAVDIDGDWAIIGAYSDDELERDAGAAYLYQRIDTSSHLQLQFCILRQQHISCDMCQKRQSLVLCLVGCV